MKDKYRAFLAAGKLVKTEIKEMNCSFEFYPISDKIESLDYCRQFLSIPLRLLLENTFTSINRDLKEIFYYP